MSFVRSLSGFFITNSNPNGVTGKEMEFICYLLQYAGNGEITVEVKDKISKQLNQGSQVTTNYLNKLKAKKVIESKGKKNKLHRVFFLDKVIIEYNGNRG